MSCIRLSWMQSHRWCCQGSLPPSLDCVSVSWLHFQAGPHYVMGKRPVSARGAHLEIYDPKEESQPPLLGSTGQILQKDCCLPWIPCPWSRPVPVEKEMAQGWHMVSARPESHKPQSLTPTSHVGWVMGLISKEQDLKQIEIDVHYRK